MNGPKCGRILLQTQIEDVNSKSSSRAVKNGTVVVLIKLRLPPDALARESAVDKSGSDDTAAERLLPHVVKLHPGNTLVCFKKVAASRGNNCMYVSLSR